MPYRYDPSFYGTGCGYDGYDCYSPSPSPLPAPWPSPAPAPSLAVSPSPAPAPSLAVSPSPALVPSPAAVVYATAAPGLPFPASPLNTGSKPQLLRTLVIVVSAVVATCALLLTYYVVRRYRSQRRRGAALAAQQAAPQPPPAPEDDLHQDLLAAVGGGEGDPYHVWHIRTVGLDEGTIGAIAAVAYRRGEGLVDGTDCAVCLGEFRDGEMLRLLPKCSHAFHIPCIDTWLRSHLNCPLCRAPILCPSPAQPLPSAANPEPPSSSPSSFTAAGAVDRPGSSEESDIWIPIELGNGGSEDEGGGIESDAPPEIDRGNRRATPQQVRRSVSMDPSALGALLRRMGLVGAAVEDGRRKPTSEAHPSAARDRGGRGACCRAQPLEMGRSASSGGGGGSESFLSRFSGRTRGAIPPV